MPRKKNVGIFVFSYFFIAGSIYYLIGNMNYDYYHFMFQQLPESVIQLRYVVTLFLRIVGIFTGIGLLLRVERFRKIAILLCLITVCLVYWKHPFFVFHNIAVRVEHGVWENSGNYVLEYPWHPWVSLIFYYVKDIVFSLWCIFYFIQPEVVSEFERKPKHGVQK